MNAHEIATIQLQWGYQNMNHLDQTIKLVQESNHPDILGLINIMADEILHQRLTGDKYMGGISLNPVTCRIESRYLLARVLSDHFPNDRLPEHITSMLKRYAYSMGELKKDRDSVQNWLMAERRFVRNGLKALENLISSPFKK